MHRVNPGRTWAEIDLDALISNFREVKKKVGAKRKILVAIKADAYGHGASEVARTLSAEGADMFGVASLDEGIELRKSGIQKPILILSPSLKSEIKRIIEYDLTPTISYLDFAQEYSQEALALGKRIKAHIEVDTGMGRTGIFYEEAPRFVQQLIGLNHIEVEGIFTHFSMAESRDKSFTLEQIANFKRLINDLKEMGMEIPLKHAANSAAILDLHQCYFNLVRPGLLLYGLYPSKEVKRAIPVKPVMSLKSRVTNLRQLPPGKSISYGRTFITKRTTKVATISAGYGDGYSRLLSNKGEVLIRGRRVKILGNICMDLTMVDVTEIPEVKIGDEVVLIGKEGKEEITVDEIAEKTQTISYEVTCGIGPRVPRIFLKEGRAVKVRSMLGEETLTE